MGYAFCLPTHGTAQVKTHDFDLFVIGAGSGGVRAARMSAALGARVAIAEERYFGGTCVNVGCIPKKLFAYGSHFGQEFEEASAYGWEFSVTGFDWTRFIDNKNSEINRLNELYRNMLDHAGVEIFESRARLKSCNEVQVGQGSLVRAERVLIATGSWPSVPELIGKDHAITSNEAFHLERLPERVAIIGGGYIAVEFASIFAGFGAKTTLVYRGDLILRNFDRGIGQFVEGELVKKGVDIRYRASPARIRSKGGMRTVDLDDGSTLEADQVMMATGRRPLIAGLGLANLGVQVGDRGQVEVNDFFESSVPEIFAIGDVIDRAMLTPVAIAEGMCVAQNLFGGKKKLLVYRDIPTAVFCQPNLATVGWSEEEARRRFPDIHVYESDFRPLKLTITDSPERTYMKVLVDGDSDRVIGVHMVGPDAGEIIQGVGIAIKSGATKTDFDNTIGIHPTAAEELVTMRSRAR